jgi:hypothetical protein
LEVAPKQTAEDIEEEFWQSVKQRKQAGARGPELYSGLMWRRTAGGVMKVRPKRWVVERTFAWLGRSRRLSKDYEMLPCSSEAFVYLGNDPPHAQETGKATDSEHSRTTYETPSLFNS